MKAKTKNLLLLTPIAVYFCYLLWWIFINYISSDSSSNFDTSMRYNFTDTYGVVALTTAVVGLFISRKWGTLRSKFGKTIFFFSVGALLQFAGQLTYALYYRIGGVYLAFPSVGDIPYMLSYISYVIAVFYLIKVIIFNQSILKSKAIVFSGMLAMTAISIISYFSFLNIAIKDERGVIYQVLNVAYPAVQSLYFLFGIIALIQSIKINQGKLFKPVALILIALIVQYAADFGFLYQSYHETWKSASINDLMFMTAYVLMALSIVMIDRVRKQVVTPSEEEAA